MAGSRWYWGGATGIACHRQALASSPTARLSQMDGWMALCAEKWLLDLLLMTGAPWDSFIAVGVPPTQAVHDCRNLKAIGFQGSTVQKPSLYGQRPSLVATIDKLHHAPS